MKDLLSFLFVVSLVLPQLDAMHANKRGSAFRKQMAASQTKTQSFEDQTRTAYCSKPSSNSNKAQDLFDSEDSTSEDFSPKNISSYQIKQPRKLYSQKQQKNETDNNIDNDINDFSFDNLSNTLDNQFTNEQLRKKNTQQQTHCKRQKKCINRTFQFKNPNIKVELRDGMVIFNDFMRSPTVSLGAGSYNGTKLNSDLHLQSTMTEKEVIAAVQRAFPGATLR